MRPGAPGGGPGRTGTPDGHPYGLGLQAWCVYLIAAHAIPVHRCAELIEALTGAEPSPGFVHSMIARAAAGRGRGEQGDDVPGRRPGCDSALRCSAW